MAGHQPAQRILFLFTEVFANGGIQRFNQTLLAACEQLGMEGLALAMQDADASIANSIGDRRIPVLGFSGNRRQFALAATRALLLEHYDHIVVGHVNFVTMTAAVLGMRPTAHGRVTLVAHGIEVWSGIGRGRRRALAKMDQVLCVSRYTRQRILEQAPQLDPQRLQIFPNALAASWRKSSPAATFRALPQRFILSVTRLEPGDRYKGIATVIEAFSMLSDPSIHYCIVGHGRDVPFLKLIAARYGVSQRVHFLHGIDDAALVSLYRDCLAFVLPSGKEGFGIVFLEAMFFGAPVIAASEKGALDVVGDGETGLMVRFGDCVAITAAIEQLVTDDALRSQLRERGRALVTDGGPFTFARFTERCAAAFDLGGDVKIAA